MNADTILGINPGTRFIGIAIMRNGMLVHAQIRAFHGAWSQKKLKKIINWVESITAKYQVTKISVKIPDAFPTSPYYNRLIGALNVFFESKEILPRYYTSSEVMKRFCGPSNTSRVELFEAIARKFPELTLELKRERRNENAHYYRLFEAVASTLM